jgi:hypothetical protein
VARNTPYSKTKPFREIAIAARANPLENHFTTASRRRAASSASAFSHTLLYYLIFDLLFVVLFLMQGNQ